MENKYYTPALEEFCAGFEFESNYMSLSKSGDWEHIKLTIDKCDSFFDNYKNDAYPTEFRVKYLDQYDIEELGFNLSYKMQDLIAFTINVDYSKIINNGILDVKEASYGICLNYSTHSNYLVIRGWLDPDDVYFKGKIKNKSELKKLLKQLNIK